ncbi:hypothetical protein SAMN06265222_101875 [Neorhodopirellula lusitana]|uniref:Uncharacterized protein n=1 Tax=Neorhodopirellula lusitana TaxID=445327 RepID=A0ABY1PQV4_9BACT|nr:hypothetical protein SAMN06265222_101875 [Neorhodopirellula lusitana]
MAAAFGVTTEMEGQLVTQKIDPLQDAQGRINSRVGFRGMHVGNACCPDIRAAATRSMWGYWRFDAAYSLVHIMSEDPCHSV